MPTVTLEVEKKRNVFLESANAILIFEFLFANFEILIILEIYNLLM